MSEKPSSRPFVDSVSFAGALYGDETTENLTQATIEVFRSTELLKKVAHQYRNVDAEKTQGRMFEILETLKFNRDAATKCVTERAYTTDSLGDPHAAADIIIKRGDQLLKEVQAKSCKTSPETTFAFAHEKYAGMDRLAVREQTERVRDLATKRAHTSALKAPEYDDVSKHTVGELRAGGAHSGGTSRSESVAAANHPDAVALKYNAGAVGTEMFHAGLYSGAAATLLGGGVETARGLYALSKGEKSFGEMASSVTVTSAKSFAAGFATGAVSKGVAHGLRGLGLGGAVKANAHVAIGAGIVKSSRAFIRYLNNEIEQEEMLGEVSETAITGTYAFYYGALGQALIPIPVVGAMIGSMAGYLAGSLLYQSGLISLGAAPEVEAARERRKHIEAICLEALPRMQSERATLTAIVNEHFALREELFTKAFAQIDSSILQWDPNGFTVSLVTICDAFGSSLPFKSFEEFDEFMENEETVFEF